MARPLRIQYEGALYHVMARGNAREVIFLIDQDRTSFLNNLGRVAGRFEWRIWAWCLMNNHYHLLVQTLQPTLSRGMREVNGVYTQSFNRRHDRVGHVLQGRYRAILVEKEFYLLELSRYIVLNPARAGLVASAGQWPWSSYRAMVNEAIAPEWLAVEETLALFHSEPDRARRAFAEYVKAGHGAPDPMDAMTHPGVLGSREFIDRVVKTMERLPPSREVPRKARLVPGLDAIEDAEGTRAGAIRAAYATGGFTQAEIGAHFDIHRSMVSKIVRRRKQPDSGSDSQIKT